MARPWFKQWWAASIPAAFERCTYVHMANIVLFAMIFLWQPIPIEVWTISQGFARDLLWAVFALGWLILFLGARSFGLLDLLGVEQMHRWCNGEPPRKPRLKTGLLYRFLRHPMYVGVLLAVWATPRMTVGHALLALGLTGYVLIAMRYEESDLVGRFGASYNRWRAQGAAPRGRMLSQANLRSLRATMSQKSSLPQPANSVSQMQMSDRPEQEHGDGDHQAGRVGLVRSAGRRPQLASPGDLLAQARRSN
jgi:protein-S-isoprenylcysteine O-methyltransferase Ste14